MRFALKAAIALLAFMLAGDSALAAWQITRFVAYEGKPVNATINMNIKLNFFTKVSLFSFPSTPSIRIFTPEVKFRNGSVAALTHQNKPGSISERIAETG